ncbi:MAG: PAS domain S-box protein [Ignavibacteria bacterium]
MKSFHSISVARATLLIYDEKLCALTNIPVASKNNAATKFKTRLQETNFSVSDKCYATGEIIIITDSSKSNIIIDKLSAGHSHIKSCIALPVKFDQNIIGVLRLDNTESPCSFSDSDIETFSMISEQLGIVINNARLFSEQKTTEKALRRSEETYKSIFEHTGTASIIIEENTIVSLVNTECIKLMGFTSEEVINKHSWTEYVRPDDIERLKEYHIGRRLNKQGIPNKYEMQITDKSGNIKYVINNISIIPGTQKTICSMIDITDRKKTELALLKFSYAVEQSPASVIITDTNGNIEYINPKFTRTSGYIIDEVIGKNPRIFRSGVTSVNEYANLWQTILNGGEWRGEFCNKKKNGEMYWESASISPIKNEKGEIIHFVAIKEDITELKEFEKQLEIAKEKAETSDRLKSEFLAQMSHEIRTPINTILSFSGLIKDELKYEADEDMKICFANINSAGDRIIRTIDLILNMSEIQAGSYEANPRTIDLFSDIIEKVYSSFAHVAKNKNLSFLLNRQTPETIIIADEYSVYQIFSNLIDNALKFTHKGSVIITIYQNRRLIVEVTDTGIGIDGEFIPSLFTPFSQEEQGYTRRFEGNGLGLAIIKKYCEMNNIEIEVRTVKNEGTTFRIIFPATEPDTK